MSKTLAEKWARIFRLEGGRWPDDGHWPEEWYSIEKTMEGSGDVASSGGGGYEDEKNESSNRGTPCVFIDNSGFLLSGGNDVEFPAIRIFSPVEIAELRASWASSRNVVIHAPNEIAWLERHLSNAEEAPTEIQKEHGENLKPRNGFRRGKQRD
jgi:hypothetical protein